MIFTLVFTQHIVILSKDGQSAVYMLPSIVDYPTAKIANIMRFLQGNLEPHFKPRGFEKLIIVMKNVF